MKVRTKEVFIEYVKKRGVIIREPFLKEEIPKKICKEHISSQINAINKFHISAMGYNNFLGDKLQDKRGRTVEQYKMYMRKTVRYYEALLQKDDLDSFEKLFINYANEYLDRADKSIKKIYKSNYLKLLKRSMNRNEVCLGNTYFTNLKGDEPIHITNTNQCCYDMVEMDLIFLLNKIKKKNKSLEWNDFVDEFCQVEGLGEDSKNFIDAVMDYPYEFVKCCMRYRKSDNEEVRHKYEKKLQKIILFDKEYIS